VIAVSGVLLVAVAGFVATVGAAVCFASLWYSQLEEDGFDADICAGCDGRLEFDNNGANICMSCGITRWEP
jgi:hypothetical protein